MQKFLLQIFQTDLDLDRKSQSFILDSSPARPDRKPFLDHLRHHCGQYLLLTFRTEIKTLSATS